ncbi:MAG: phosphocholine cytidylyltransferase family protein [Myxococcales bacterium]|nr:phosphocholine cytidylyltransferase family protein [Myxococcales bacterium]
MSTRVAVILVAGLGSRLSPLTDDRPKALVEVGGETILHRAVRQLRAHGVQRVVLATGYRGDAIERVVPELGVDVELVPNPLYASTQNSVSLALCRDAVGTEDFFKLDGDVIFDKEVLARLDRAATPLAVAIDRTRTVDAEAMKVIADGDRITAFGKGISLDESAGESIGIERISGAAGQSIFARLTEAFAQGLVDRYYEDHYGDLIREGKLSAQAVDVGDLPWTEVDDHQDLAVARTIVGVERGGR